MSQSEHRHAPTSNISRIRPASRCVRAPRRRFGNLTFRRRRVSLVVKTS